MPAAQRTITIDRPPEQVFAFFTDPDNDLRWRSHVKEAAARGPIGVGSSVHQVVSGPGGRGIPADLEVTAYEPSSHLRSRSSLARLVPSASFDLGPLAREPR